MTNRGMINWSIWISACCGLYIFLYLISPLSQYGVIYCTFVGFALYFLAGAKKEDIPNFMASFVLGVVWGWVYLQMIGLLGNYVPGNIATALTVFLATTACCVIHFVLTPNTIFNKVPAMFSAIAMMFSTGGANPVPIAITLVGSVVLAYVCNLGLKLLDAEGRWCKPHD